MKRLFFSIILTFAACTHAELKSDIPAAIITPEPLPAETPPPIAIAPEPTSGTITKEQVGSLDELLAIATGSKCAATEHGTRGTRDYQGVPPKSYLRGIALSFARSVCQPGREAVKVAARAVGPASQDALAHYGLNPETPEKRLEAVYALMIGSAARESSWRWCVGKDPGASNTSSETCEAGLYQTSYNSRKAHPVLPALYAEFKADKSACFEAVYKGKTTCSEYNLKNWGVGEGAEFQRLTKNCPGFASEYHAVMLRTQRTHYGPINRKMVTFVPACADMFGEIARYVAAHPGVCFAL